MSADDTLPPRPPPRLVPTLTEVVGRAPSMPITAADQGLAWPAPVVTAPATASTMPPAFEPDLEQRIAAAVERALQGERREVEALVQRLATRAAREVIAETLIQDKTTRDVGTNT